MTTLREKIGDWSPEDRANLSTLLELEDSASVEQIEESFMWLYHSRTRQNLKDKIGLAVKKARVEKGSLPFLVKYEIPSWEQLVSDFAKRLKVHSEEKSTEQLEEYVCHAVIVQALSAMSPESRSEFFNKSINIDEIVNSANIENPSLKGPQTALGLLSAVQLPGFSMYMASTTALGFASGSSGVTLPFAAYTGLTTTLSILTGPVGFTAAALWGVWSITGPEWKKLGPIILYVICHDSRLKVGD